LVVQTRSWLRIFSMSRGTFHPLIHMFAFNEEFVIFLRRRILLYDGNIHNDTRGNGGVRCYV
jgi:hypothetical protein